MQSPCRAYPNKNVEYSGFFLMNSLTKETSTWTPFSRYIQKKSKQIQRIEFDGNKIQMRHSFRSPTSKPTTPHTIHLLIWLVLFRFQKNVRKVRGFFCFLIVFLCVRVFRLITVKILFIVGFFGFYFSRSPLSDHSFHSSSNLNKAKRFVCIYRQREKTT